MSYILSWNLSITDTHGTRAALDTQGDAHHLTLLDSIGISSFLWDQSSLLALCQIVCSCNFCFLSSSHFNTRAEIIQYRIIEQSCIFPNSHYQFFRFTQVLFHNSISISQEKSLLVDFATEVGTGVLTIISPIATIGHDIQCSSRNIEKVN